MAPCQHGSYICLACRPERFHDLKQQLLDEIVWMPYEKTGRHGRDRGWFIWHARQLLGQIESGFSAQDDAEANKKEA